MLKNRYNSHSTKEIGFILTEFYEFWEICVSQGLNKKRAKDDPHVELKSIFYAETKSRRF